VFIRLSLAPQPMTTAHRQQDFEAALATVVAENSPAHRFLIENYSFPPEQVVAWQIGDEQLTRLPPAVGDEFIRRIEPHKLAWQIEPSLFRRDGRNCLFVPTAFYNALFAG
jgi:hypothetical protein